MIMTGKKDKIIPPFNARNQQSLYSKFYANIDFKENNYKHVWSIDVEPSDTWPESNCEEEDIIQNCRDDYAGKILKFLYESLNPNFKMEPKI